MDNTNRRPIHQFHHDASGWPIPTSQALMDDKQYKYPLRLLSMHPNQGQEGTTFTLTLDYLPSSFTYRIAFNSLMVETRQMQQLTLQNDLTSTTTILTATVPSLQTTLCDTPTVPISVCFLNGSGMIEDTCYVATFTYETTAETPSPLQQRKRRYSITDETSSSPAKRVTRQDHSYKPSIPSHSSATFSSYNNMPYPSYTQRHGNPSGQDLPSPFQPGQDSALPTIIESSSHEMQQYYFAQSYSLPSTSLPAPAPAAPAPAAPLPAAPLPAAPLPAAPSPVARAPVAPAQQQRRKSHSQRSGMPILKSTSHQSSTSVATYQPYPGQVDYSNFELVDDLDTMMHQWTMAEQQQGRRLVRFWCKDDPTTGKTRCGCHPITQNDPIATDANHTIVSCIYWPEQDDFYITSVDCIYLLESLLRTHFGVDEKNRIRRNLEGFRPVTVAKGKPTSADFFKRVMGYPHPKPRNIEKDIKAFHWKVLPFAIKKIVTKYAMESAANQRPVNDLPSQKYGMLPPSLHSRTTSLGSETTIMSSTSSTSSSMPTPPSVCDDDSMLHYYQQHRKMYYNPSTMTYGDHQEPGVRFADDSSPSSAAVPSPSSPSYRPDPKQYNLASLSTTPFQSADGSRMMDMNSPLFTSDQAPFVSQLLMGPYNLL